MQDDMNKFNIKLLSFCEKHYWWSKPGLIFLHFDSKFIYYKLDKNSPKLTLCSSSPEQHDPQKKEIFSSQGSVSSKGFIFHKSWKNLSKQYLIPIFFYLIKLTKLTKSRRPMLIPVDEAVNMDFCSKAWNSKIATLFLKEGIN